MNMKQVIFLVSILALSIAGCQSGRDASLDNPVIGVRTAMENESSISLKDDVENIEYIPLETNDSCLISNLLSLQVTKDFLFMYNGKNGQVLQFDRKGKFVRRISRRGNGPREYGMISELVVDNNKKELLVFQYGEPVMVYSFDGDYLRSDTTMEKASGMYAFPDGKLALKGMVMTPFQQAPWAGALRGVNGELQETKNVYPGSISEDVRYMKDICFSPSAEGVLLFTACNDTVFRIADSGIKPAYILERKNSQNYYDGIADINRLADSTVEDDEAIGVYDLFETPRYFYARYYKGDGIYLQQFNKETGELKSHRVPDAYAECSEMVPGNNVLGLDNDMDGGVPFWPEYSGYDGIRAQVVSSYAVSSLRDKGYLKNAPAALNMGEDDNPVVILYTFKK